METMDFAVTWVDGSGPRMARPEAQVRERRGEFLLLDEKSLPAVCDIVRRQKAPLLCLNDKGSDVTPDRCFEEISAAFESILPGKSSFEK